MSKKHNQRDYKTLYSEQSDANIFNIDLRDEAHKDLFNSISEKITSDLKEMTNEEVMEWFDSKMRFFTNGDRDEATNSSEDIEFCLMSTVYDEMWTILLDEKEIEIGEEEMSKRHNDWMKSNSEETQNEILTMGHKRILRREGKTESEINDIYYDGFKHFTTDENGIEKFSGAIKIPKECYDGMMRGFKLNKWKKQYVIDKWGHKERVILKNGELYEAKTDRRIRGWTDEEYLKTTPKSEYSHYLRAQMRNGYTLSDAQNLWSTNHTEYATEEAN